MFAAKLNQELLCVYKVLDVHSGWIPTQIKHLVPHKQPEYSSLHDISLSSAGHITQLHLQYLFLASLTAGL